jgi:hypothetical protein
MDSKRIPPNADTKSQRRRDLQKRNRRTRTLILKAVDMSVLCDADIFLGIQVRETGRVTTFCSNPSGIWSSVNLVCTLRKPKAIPLIVYRKAIFRFQLNTRWMISRRTVTHLLKGLQTKKMPMMRKEMMIKPKFPNMIHIVFSTRDGLDSGYRQTYSHFV